MELPAPLETPPTLLDAIRMLDTLPEDRTLTVYDRRGRKATSKPYAETARRGRRWASWLRSQGVEAEQVVFLCLPTSHDLIEAFLGAAILGAYPCCLALPRAIGGMEVFTRRLERLGATFPQHHMVTTAAVGAEVPLTHWVVPDELPEAEVAVGEARGEDLAYVQLTSGSTTDPKAVAITHTNLAANTRGIYLGARGPQIDSFVSWLPLYHDMGLVGIAFTALFHGYPLVLMPPEAFLGTPLRWIEAIGNETRTVVTSAPNFGYQWCVDRLSADKLIGLDLSNWRVACCGAEMVRPQTLQEFVQRFGPVGFRSDSFLPCFGMAETTLAVTICPPRPMPKLRDGVVSCGVAIDGLEVEIRPVEEERALPEGEEGEVCVRGSSVFAGYYQNPAATAEVLREGWFRTGDLGCLVEGELYITGRVKDLLIVDGANLAPHELEWVAQAHLPLEGGRAAAFSVEVEGRERAVLVVEVRQAPEAAAVEATRQQVAREFTPLHDLVLVRRGSLPKTSSGKVQRGRVRAQYLDGTLEVIQVESQGGSTA